MRESERPDCGSNCAAPARCRLPRAVGALHRCPCDTVRRPAFRHARSSASADPRHLPPLLPTCPAPHARGPMPMAASPAPTMPMSAPPRVTAGPQSPTHVRTVPPGPNTPLPAPLALACLLRGPHQAPLPSAWGPPAQARRVAPAPLRPRLKPSRRPRRLPRPGPCGWLRGHGVDSGRPPPALSLCPAAHRANDRPGSRPHRLEGLGHEEAVSVACAGGAL